MISGDTSHAPASGSADAQTASNPGRNFSLSFSRSFFAKEEGQGLVEYALILVLIAIVVIGILSLLGGKVSQVFSTINSGLNP